jgi:hypothetical protein
VCDLKNAIESPFDQISTVYTVFLLDLASTTMCIADAFHWFAEGFGNLFTLDDIHLSAIDTPMLGACLAAIAQSYYCYRLWTINRKTLPICILVVLVCNASSNVLDSH